jgi:hypothetical protein
MPPTFAVDPRAYFPDPAVASASLTVDLESTGLLGSTDRVASLLAEPATAWVLPQLFFAHPVIIEWLL